MTSGKKQQQPSSTHEEPLDAPPVPWMHGAAGILGGSISMTLFYPLDLMRTRMHMHDGTAANRRSVRDIVAQERLRGLYRGVTVAVASHSIGWGTYLTLFRAAQDRSRRLNNGKDSLFGDFCSATFAAVSTATIVTPLNVMKTRKQLNTSKAGNDKVVRGLSAIYREEGFSKLFRGVGPQIVLSLHTTIQVALYEYIKRTWIAHHAQDRQPNQPLPTYGVVGASAFSKAVASVLCNPLEVCRTRMQAKRTVGESGYGSLAESMRTIWQSEGVRGLYRGTVYNVCRVVPTTVVAFVLYEKCLSGIHCASLTRQRLGWATAARGTAQQEALA